MRRWLGLVVVLVAVLLAACDPGPAPAPHPRNATNTGPDDTLSVPSETFGAPSETVDVPRETVTGASETVDVPSETVTEPSEAPVAPSETVAGQSETVAGPSETVAGPSETPPSETVAVPSEVVTASGGTVIVYGDSLITEAVTELQARLPDFMPDRLLLIRAFGGTAQCDFHDEMVADADAVDVGAVVIAFSGNNLTPCIQSRPFIAGYAADAAWAADFWRSRGVPVIFVESVGLLETSPGTYLVGSAYASVAASHGETLADTTPYFARGEPRVYSRWMPCLAGECFGYVEVRRADGHLCPIPSGGLPCPIYSSGVMRYVEVMWRATAQRLGYAVAPPRPEETRIFATR